MHEYVARPPRLYYHLFTKGLQQIHTLLTQFYFTGFDLIFVFFSAYLYQACVSKIIGGLQLNFLQIRKSYIDHLHTICDER